MIENSKLVKINEAEVEADTEIVMIDEALANVTISKQDVHSKEIKGATLTLSGKDSEGNSLTFPADSIETGEGATLVNGSGDTLVWISGNQPTQIRNLDDGTYTLHEEVAPNGYKVATDITFVIEGSKLVKIGEEEVHADAQIVMIDEAEEATTTTTWITGELGEEDTRTTTVVTETTPVSETDDEDERTRTTEAETQTAEATTQTSAETVTTVKSVPTGGVNPKTGSVRTGDSAPIAVAFVGILMGAVAFATRKRRDDDQ